MKSYNKRESAPANDVEVCLEGNILRVFFDHRIITLNIVEEGKPRTEKVMECENVDVYGGREYDNIVSAIVNDRYSTDDVQAVLANYAEASASVSVLAIDPAKKEEYLQEYADFQNWRKTAKDVAKKVLNLIA